MAEPKYFCIKCGNRLSKVRRNPKLVSWLCDRCLYDPELDDIVRCEPKCAEYFHQVEASTIRLAIMSYDLFSVAVWNELSH